MTDDHELRAFFAGIKPALRISSQLDAVFLSKLSRAVIVRDGELIYAARDHATAQALCDAERTIRPGGAARPPELGVLEAHRELGRLLGYPRCCVEAFVERVARGVDRRRDGARASERFVAAEDARDRSTLRLGRLNFLIPSRALIPFDPCALDCAIAARYADAMFTILGAPDPLRELLGAPIALTLEGRRVDPRGAAALVLTFDHF